jgi:hypothetical protein
MRLRRRSSRRRSRDFSSQPESVRAGYYLDWTLGIVAGVLAGSALLAGLVPARRAASVNPMEALRAD